MMKYTEMTARQRQAEYDAVLTDYEKQKALGLKLNMVATVISLRNARALPSSLSLRGKRMGDTFFLLYRIGERLWGATSRDSLWIGGVLEKPCGFGATSQAASRPAPLKGSQSSGNLPKAPLEGDSTQCGEMSRSDRRVRPRKRCHR